MKGYLILLLLIWTSFKSIKSLSLKDQLLSPYASFGGSNRQQFSTAIVPQNTKNNIQTIDVSDYLYAPIFLSDKDVAYYANQDRFGAINLTTYEKGFSEEYAFGSIVSSGLSLIDVTINNITYDGLFTLTSSTSGSRLILYQIDSLASTSPSILTSYSTSYSASVGGRFDQTSNLYIFGTYALGATGDTSYDTENRILAIDATTGSLEFMYPPSSSSIGLIEGVFAPPAISSTYQLAYFRISTYIIAIDLETQEQAWNISLSTNEMVSSSCTSPPSTFSSSEVFKGGVVIDDEYNLYVNDGNCIFHIALEENTYQSTKPGNPSIQNHKRISANDSPILTTPSLSSHGVIYVSVDSSIIKLSKGLRLRWENNQILDNNNFQSIENEPLVMGQYVLIQPVGSTYYVIDQQDGDIISSSTFSTTSTLYTPTLDTFGRLFFSISHLVYIQGNVNGGCDVGMEWNDALTIALPSSFCTLCSAGFYKNEISNTITCKSCSEGLWVGEEGSGFCYPCAKDSWCPGEDVCKIGREGYACVDCIEGRYQFGDECRVCPEGSFLITLAVFSAFLFLLFLLYQCCGMSVYTKGTLFLQELKAGDKLSIKNPLFYIESTNQNTAMFFKKPIVREIKRVYHDYLCEVYDEDLQHDDDDENENENDENKDMKGKVTKSMIKKSHNLQAIASRKGSSGISNIRYRIQKKRIDGQSRWFDGSGLVSIRPLEDEMIVKDKYKDKELSFFTKCSLMLGFKPSYNDGDDDDDNDDDDDDTNNNNEGKDKKKIKKKEKDTFTIESSELNQLESILHNHPFIEDKNEQEENHIELTSNPFSDVKEDTLSMTIGNDDNNKEEVIHHEEQKEKHVQFYASDHNNDYNDDYDDEYDDDSSINSSDESTYDSDSSLEDSSDDEYQEDIERRTKKNEKRMKRRKKRRETTLIYGKSTSGLQMLATGVIISITFFQMVSMFLSFNLSWPPFMLKWLSALQIPILFKISTFQVMEFVMSPECDWSMDYFETWYMIVFFPCILFMIFLGIYLYAPYHYQNPRDVKNVQDKLIQSGLVLTTIFYVDMTAKTVQPFDCYTVSFLPTEYESTPTSSLPPSYYNPTLQVMDDQPQVECTYLVGEYGLISGIATLMFVLYGFGVPLTIFLLLFKAKRHHLLSNPSFSSRYGWLYMRYNRDKFGWEIMVLIRKLSIVLIRMLNSQSPRLQSKNSIILLSCFLLLQIKFKPFVCYDCIKQRKKRCVHWSSNDILETCLLIGSILLLIFADTAFEGSFGERLQSFLILAILCGALVIIGFVLYHADRKNHKEQKQLEEEGYLSYKSGTQRGVYRAQAGLAML